MINYKDNKSLFFLFFVILIYLVILIINTNKFVAAINQFFNIFKNVFYVLIIIFILMIITEYFINPKIIVKYIGKNAGIKGWIISIIGGIISTGPIYMWYPLLKDLKKKGARNAYIAAFLYNRSVKIPIIPIMIFYFTLKYVIVLLFIMIFISIVQGIILEKVLEVKI